MPEQQREQSKLSLLYVEDDDGVRESLLRFLRRRFERVTTANDGQEGLDLYIELKPDIVVTDIQMPIMDGLKMSEKIREINPSVPIIVTTAYNNPPYLASIERIGINYRLQKPIIKDDLIEAIEACGKLIVQNRSL